MTQAQAAGTAAKTTAAATKEAAEPIIELVETIPLRYIALAVAAGFVISFLILYGMSDRIARLAQDNTDEPEAE